MVGDGETRSSASAGQAAHERTEAEGGVSDGQAQSARKERAGRCSLKKKSSSVTALQFARPQSNTSRLA